MSNALPKSERARLRKLTKLELLARSKGFKYLAGIDEAGRGPLAGPVVAAACMIEEGCLFPGVKDSKMLDAKMRQVLFERLKEHSGVRYGVGIIDHSEIDRINIFQATLAAMRLAVDQLPQRPDYLFVDGVHLDITGAVCERLIEGEQHSQMIAAASIIAKQTRDQLMREYHDLYPLYGFDQHKGYATLKHREAIAKYGPCPIHRLSFSPLNGKEEKAEEAQDSVVLC